MNRGYRSIFLNIVLVIHAGAISSTAYDNLQLTLQLDFIAFISRCSTFACLTVILQ